MEEGFQLDIDFQRSLLTQLLNICERSGHSEQILSLAVTGSWKLNAQHGLYLSGDPRSGHWSHGDLLDVLAQLYFDRTHM